MLTRLYVHNFRCLENFELAFGERSSVLLLGRNGSGKTTVRQALEVLHRIARGTNRVGELVKPADFAQRRTDAPMRFEIAAMLDGHAYAYAVALEYPSGFRELRVLEESLAVDGAEVFSRDHAQTRLARAGNAPAALFRIDWHLVALPILQDRGAVDPLAVFRQWLATMLLIGPVPSLVRGDSEQGAPELVVPDPRATNLGAWFSSLVAAEPGAYAQVSQFLREVMPDFEKISNPPAGKDRRAMALHFLRDQNRIEIPVEDLSDGEKCFLVFALTIAMNHVFGPTFCFWDEPDNFLSPDEVGHAVMALRRCFKDRGQLIVTSHNPEAIRRFPEESIFHLFRRSHVDPVRIVPLEEIRASGRFAGSLVDALIRGDTETDGDTDAHGDTEQ